MNEMKSFPELSSSYTRLESIVALLLEDNEREMVKVFRYQVCHFHSCNSNVGFREKD